MGEKEILAELRAMRKDIARIKHALDEDRLLTAAEERLLARSYEDESGLVPRVDRGRPLR